MKEKEHLLGRKRARVTIKGGVIRDEKSTYQEEKRALFKIKRVSLRIE